jgi:GNAT superfamily N-acetyltransferase
METKSVQEWNEERVDDLRRLYQQVWWARDRTPEQIRTVLEHSDLVLGLCEPESGRMIAFARVLTDRIFKAWIFDVIVDEENQGRGLGQALLDRICSHEMLRDVQHFELYCRDEMVPFYERWGFLSRTDVTLMRRTTR